MIKTRIVRALVQPRLISSGAAVALYMAGGGLRCPYNFGGIDYKAGVAGIPRFKAAVGWDDAGWTGGIVPTTASLVWAPSTIADYKNYSTLYLWKDAPITIEVGDEGFDGSAPASWTTLLIGTVADIAASDGQITLTIADLSAKLDKPLLTGRFAGTGGIEGPTEAATRIKRRTFGTAFNIECRILDKVNSIYEWGDPAFQSTSVTALRDMGRGASPAWSIVAWQGSVAATFAALQAAVASQGSGVVAPSIQCVKWWTTPVGPLTVDVIGEGGGLSAPNIATYLIDLFGGAYGLSYTGSDRTAAIAARPDGAGLHIDDDSTTLANALDRVLLGVSMVWVSDATGVMRFLPITFASPVETITSLGASRKRAYPPQKNRRLGYQRNQRIHNDGEIAASLLLSDVQGAGALAGQNAADFATQVTGAEKPSNYATTDLTISVSNASINRIGNTFVQNVVTGDYNYFAVATGIVGPAFVEADIAASSFTVVGLDDASADTGLAAQLAMAFYNRDNGATHIYSGGSLIFNPGLASGLTGKISLAFDGVKLRLSIAGVERYAADAPAGMASAAALFPKLWTYSSGVTYTGLRAGPFNNAAWSSLGGSGKPADNASSDLKLTTISSAPTVVGNTITQSSTTGYAYTIRADALIGPCFAECDISGLGYTLVTLDDDTTTYDYPTMLALGYYNKTTGVWAVFSNGVQQGTGTIATGLTGKIALIYDGVKVRLWVAGVERFNATAWAGFTGSIYPKWTPYESGVLYTGLRAGYYTDNAWSSVGGSGKPADNATVNRVTYSISAPASPVDGDVWVDTSLNPNVTRVRISGAWQIAANLTTNTNQLTDGAALGQTAVWVSVTGANKPADNASADLKLTDLSSGKITISGNNLTNTGYPSDYSCCAVGQKLYGPCYIEMDATFDGSWTMFGLDNDNTNTSYATQEVMVQFNGNTGSLAIYTNGGAVAYSGSLSLATGAKIALVYDGAKIRFFGGGAEITSFAAPAYFTPNGGSFPKWWAYSARGVVPGYTGIRAGPYNNADGGYLGDKTVSTPKVSDSAISEWSNTSVTPNYRIATTGTWYDVTGASIAITTRPTSEAGTQVVEILATIQLTRGTGSSNTPNWRVLRSDGTQIGLTYAQNLNDPAATVTAMFVDTAPTANSSLTYKLQGYSSNGDPYFSSVVLAGKLLKK